MVFSGSKDVASHRCIKVLKNKSVALFGLLDVSDDRNNCTTSLSRQAVLGKIAKSLQNAVKPKPRSMASEWHFFFFFLNHTSHYKHVKTAFRLPSGGSFDAQNGVCHLPVNHFKSDARA